VVPLLLRGSERERRLGRRGPGGGLLAGGGGACVGHDDAPSLLVGLGRRWGGDDGGGGLLTDRLPAVVLEAHALRLGAAVLTDDAVFLEHLHDELLTLNEGVSVKWLGGGHLPLGHTRRPTRAGSGVEAHAVEQGEPAGASEEELLGGAEG